MNRVYKPLTKRSFQKDQDLVESLKSAESQFFFLWITQKTFLAKFLPHLQCNGHFSEGSSAGGLPEGTKTNVGHSLALRYCWWKKKKQHCFPGVITHFQVPYFTTYHFSCF